MASDNYGVEISADPAGTGAEHSITFADELILVGWDVALVTDANAANRHVNFTIEDAEGNVFFRAVAGGTQAASLTRRYSARKAEYAAPAVADTVFVIPLPADGVYVPAGGKLKTVTTSVQATDNYGILTYQFKRPN